MLSTRRVLGALAAVTTAAGVAVAVPLVTSGQAQAAGFTGGSLVVYRVGDGTAALTNAAAPVYLDSFSATGTALGSVALPTTDGVAGTNRALTAAGESRSEGLISRSADGRTLLVTGYEAPVGTLGPSQTSLTASSPTSVHRVVGVVDGNGNADTSTVLSGDASPAIVRSAASPGGDRLLVGGGDGGLLATSVGSSTSARAAGTTDANLNAVTAQSGAVFTSGILDDRLALVDGSSLVDVPGLPDNLLTYGYAFLDESAGGWHGTTADTLYLADASNRAGTIDKYHYNGTTWVLAGSVSVPGVTGLVANATGGAVSLAATTPTQLLTLSDPAGSASTFAATSPTVLATAKTGTEFRGVALAPTAPAGPSAFLHSPAAGSTVSIAGTTVPVTAYVPASPAAAGVTVSIGATTVSAVKGAGDVWTAQVPTSDLTAGPATVTVRATDAAGSTTDSRSVVLSGSSTTENALAAGTHPASDAKIHRKGAWKAYATTASPTKKGLTASAKGSALTASVYGRSLTVVFTKAKTDGKVVVTVDGKATTIDLYAAKTGTLSRSFTLGSVGTHTLAITVSGAKNHQSKGTAVPVAAVKVA